MTDPRPLTLVTWFHADEPGRAGSYAQALGDAASTSHHEVYLRCVDLCAASFRRWNPDGRLLVVLNPRADRAISPGRRAFWAEQGVEALVAENRHLPADELYSRWQNQFFLFDVIAAAIAHVGDPATPIAVVDSDCLIRADLAPLVAAIESEGRVAMSVGYREDADIHGLTRRDLGRLMRDRDSELDGVPEYQGGEFVAGTAAALTELLAAAQNVYEWTLQRRAAGLVHPNEEAHVISIAAPLRADEVTGNRFVERIWTQRWVYRGFSGGVEAVSIWHLPAEKRTGLARLHRAALDPASWFHTAAAGEWRRRVGDEVGVPRYGLRKAALDARALAVRLVPALRRRWTTRPG